MKVLQQLLFYDCDQSTQEKQKGSIPKDTPLVRVSLKDLANASRINVLQAASKALLSTTERNLR